MQKASTTVEMFPTERKCFEHFFSNIFFRTLFFEPFNEETLLTIGARATLLRIIVIYADY